MWGAQELPQAPLAHPTSLDIAGWLEVPRAGDAHGRVNDRSHFLGQRLVEHGQWELVIKDLIRHFTQRCGQWQCVGPLGPDRGRMRCERRGN